MSQTDVCPTTQDFKHEAERILSRQQYQTEEKDKIEKARKAGRYLRLMVHSLECRGDCSNPAICKKAKLLYQHCIACNAKQNCPIDGCFQTKKLLHHVTLCRWERQRNGGSAAKECLICSTMDEQNADRSHSGASVNRFPVPMTPKRFRADSMPDTSLMSIPEETRSVVNRSTSFNHDSGRSQRLASI
mmetsp:Transcript_9556/g.14382  ORF Transcript_9556/g.14382 Transcript_9556/m.14382 type:complete len:188 (+) Transcript_9556:136-699(+)